MGYCTVCRPQNTFLTSDNQCISLVCLSSYIFKEVQQIPFLTLILDLRVCNFLVHLSSTSLNSDA